MTQDLDIRSQTMVTFERIDLVTVCGIELDVLSIIELVRNPGALHVMRFDIKHRFCGMNFRFKLYVRLEEGEWVFWEDTADVLSEFLSGDRFFVKTDEFLVEFRNAMERVFEFEESKRPLCGNMQLWDMLELNANGEEREWLVLKIWRSITNTYLELGSNFAFYSSMLRHWRNSKRVRKMGQILRPARVKGGNVT